MAKPAMIITMVSSIVSGATSVPNRFIVWFGIPNHVDVAFSADKLGRYATTWYIGFSR